MKSIYKSYINNLINSFITLSDNSKNTLFIKHYNTFNIYKEDMEDIISEYSDIHLLYKEYDISKIKEAYEPVLDWIKELYNLYFTDMDIDSFLEGCDTYPLHIPIIRSYIVTGKCFREEDIIVTEIKYEYKEFLTSLSKILCKISLRIPLVIVFNKLHSAGLSTIDFIINFIENQFDNNIVFIATYNEAYTVSTYMQDSWLELMNKIEDFNILSEWEMREETALDYEKEEIILKIEDLSEYIVSLGNMITAITVKQALYYSDLIYTKLEIDKIEINKKLKIKYLIVYAIVNLYNDNMSKTLLLCDNVRSLCEQIGDLDNMFLCNYLSGLAQIYNGQYFLAEDFAKICKDIAIKRNSYYFSFKSDLLAYMAKFRGWRGLFLCNCTYKIEEDFIKCLKKYNYRNHLAYINIMGYENNDENIKEEFENDNGFKYFNKGVEIAKELKNYSFLLLAYNKMIIVASCNGKYKIVEEYYGKCIEIARRINDRVQEATVYNGLGYNSIVSENYNKASINLSHAIKIFYEMNSIEDIAESIYNLGINSFVAFQYEDANEYFNLTLKIIDNLKIGSIRVCNISKIYGLIALCNYYLGVEYNSYLYFNKMKVILSHLLEPEDEPSFKLWDDDLFLYYLLRGLIQKKEKDYENAIKSFEIAEYHMKMATGSLFYTYVILTSEKAKLYKQMGQYNKAEDILREGIDYCEYKGYFNRNKFLNAELKGIPYIHKRENLGLQFIGKNQILDLSKRIGAEKELEEQRKELSFLLLWQETLNRESTSKEDLIKNSMITIKNNFSVERIIYIDLSEDDNGKIAFQDEHTNINKEGLSKIINYFKTNPREFSLCRNDGNFEMYSDILNVLGKNKVFSIIGIPILTYEKLQSILIAYIPVYDNFIGNKVALNERHLYIFRYIFKQLLDEINKLEVHKQIEEINKQLHQIAITDVLTGLYNRKGFEKRLEEEEETTILYVDLDNFKYYNDSFGHDIGDYVLVLLAEIFKIATYTKGYVVRYGGDEFILAVPDGCNEDGVEIANYIFEAIGEGSKFRRDIESRVGRPIKHKLSCSIGIATSKNGSKDSIMMAIKNADEVLYKVKKSGKNSYRIYE